MSENCLQAAQRKPSIRGKSSGRVPVIFPGQNLGTCACVPPGTKKTIRTTGLDRKFFGPVIICHARLAFAAELLLQS